MTKGIILTAGKGTRLYPITKVVPKALVPIYDRPMIDYAIQTLVSLGVDDILIICSSDGINRLTDYVYLQERVDFQKEYFGKTKFSFNVQEVQNGIAGALQLAKGYIKESDEDYFYLMLCDNIFVEPVAKPQKNVATIYWKEVEDPSRFGVWNPETQKIIEKPKEFISNMAVTGLYYLPPNAVDKAFNVKPSARGELEITDLINLVGESETVEKIEIKGEWLDTGTFDSLLEASNILKNKK